LKARMPWLDINQERHHPYGGYEGMVELVHEIDRALFNPVWQQVRIPAPWGDDGETLDAVPASTAGPEAALASVAGLPAPMPEPLPTAAHQYLSDVAAQSLGLSAEEIPV